jgi:uncharacterized membrane protein YsdA (DUF1294 family)
MDENIVTVGHTNHRKRKAEKNVKFISENLLLMAQVLGGVGWGGVFNQLQDCFLARNFFFKVAARFSHKLKSLRG